LVEIGSVVSEKIFFNFISGFSIFSLAAILVGIRDHRTKFWKGPSKDHSTKVLLQLGFVAIGLVVSKEKIFM
jgi:hypothetical protein